MTAPMTPERLAEIRQAGWIAWCQVVQVLNEAEAALAEVDRLRAENARAMECFDRDQKAIADLQAERGRLRAQVDAAREVLRDLEYPNPEADQDWSDDPVGCIRDALRAALASGDKAYAAAYEERTS